MESTQLSAFFKAAESLDKFRSFVLRHALAIPILQEIYRVRAYRLFFLFLIFTGVSLCTSLFIPLWTLVLGPVFYGVPHLISGFRYFHYNVRERRNEKLERKQMKLLFGLLVLAWGSSIAYLWFDSVKTGLPLVADITEWKKNNSLDFMALIATFVGSIFIYKKSASTILKNLIFIAPFFWLTWKMPPGALGTLILLHNFIALYYWIISSKTVLERRVAFGATLLTLGLTSFIFLGGFDWFYFWAKPNPVLEFAQLQYSFYGSLFIPNATDELIHYRTAVAFAFGHAVHYFAWLKAIPDQNMSTQVPASFRQSLTLLKTDFGAFATKLIVLACIAAALSYVVLSFRQARDLYFLLAAFHGYLDIVGIGLMSHSNKTG